MTLDSQKEISEFTLEEESGKKDSGIEEERGPTFKLSLEEDEI